MRDHYQTTREQRIRATFKAALTQHTPVEPGQLIATLAGQPDAWSSLHQEEVWHRATDALLKIWGGLVRYQAAPSAIQGGTIAWALDSLATWSPGKDPHKVQLSSALVVFSVLEAGPWPWPALPETFALSDELVQMLREELPTLVGTVESSLRAELWEAELIEKVLRADRALDWQILSDYYMVCESVREALCTPLLTGAATLLAYADITAMGPVADTAKTPLEAQVYLEPLSVEQRLVVAVSSSSPLVALAAIELSCANRIYVLSSRELSLMEQLFSRAAEDADCWAQWMQLLNRDPQSRVTVQPALGGALAALGAAQWQAYVDSIDMRPVDRENQSRGAIGACLAAFHGACVHEVRGAMWAMIFDRWTNWNFAADDKRFPLLGVRWSELDYGVIAYFNECLDIEARQAYLNEIVQRLADVRSTWFLTRTDFDSAVYRLESSLQPVCIADQCTSDQWSGTKSVWAPTLEESVKRYRELHLIGRVR